MFNSFFRKDLNLQNKWWHRLLKVLFITFIIFLIVYFTSSSFSQPSKYQETAKISDRVTPDVKSLEDMKKLGEKIGVSEKSSVYSLYYDDVYSDSVYCSSEIYNHIENLKSSLGIFNLYIEELYHRNNVPLDTFSNYLKENDINCVLQDSYTYSDSNRVEFLTPFGDDNQLEDVAFYRKSTTDTILHAIGSGLVDSLITAAIALLLMIIYYKVFLYIIFGSNKKE